MKRLFLLIVMVLITKGANAQYVDFFTYDPCYETKNKQLERRYTRAFDAYYNGNYNLAGTHLASILKEDEEPSTAYFLIALIAAQRGNDRELRKFISRVEEACPDYNHPLYFYLKGVINYTDENFGEAVQDFDLFFESIDTDYIVSDSIFEEANNYYEWSVFLDRSQGVLMPYSPRAISEVSTPNNEYWPYITLDGKSLYFTRTVDEIIEDDDSFYDNTEVITKELLFVSNKKDGYEFGLPIELDEPFNYKYFDSKPSLTADNSEIYFTRCDISSGELRCGIYMSEWLGDYWSEAKSLGPEVNRSGYISMDPCITPNGKVLYFSSNRSGGLGGYDIWVAYKQENGRWSRVSNLGERVNTPLDEKSPYLHGDDRSFYFLSSGWMGFGGLDNFYINLRDRKMRKPINLGLPINTEADDEPIRPMLRDGLAYTSSNLYNNDKSWDIVVFDLYDEVGPTDMTIVKGRVNIDEIDYKNVVLELISLEDKSKKEYSISNANGGFAVVIGLDKQYLLKASCEGYAFESRIINREDEPRIIELNMLPLEVGSSYVINDILFESNSYELNDEAIDIIEEFVDYLNRYPKIRCTIEGHTDSLGDREDNMVLSEKRAKTVAERIIARRIRDDRVRYEGYGASKPIGDNSTEEGRKLNRRTLFRIDAM